MSSAGVFDRFGPDVWELTPQPEVAHRALSWLISNPLRADVGLFVARPHDDVAGSNRGDFPHYWRAHHRVLDDK
jgi:hypothetical protein